ncbi:hypothetical protein B0H10DRAFT_1873171 [Mycena sp. CBHHK59/15]|nr:hypothetical protein B0H10DRAFT_1873171 [Mycena sp. CBHHK59/15]
MATSITSISAIPLSPTISSISSFAMASSRSRSSTASSQSFEIYLEDSDDEIVWSVSEDSVSSSGISAESNGSPASDDDFVVLSRPRSPRAADTRVPTPATGGANIPNTLASDLARLSVNQVSATIRRNKKAAMMVKVHKSQDDATASHKGGHAKPAATPRPGAGGSCLSPTSTPISTSTPVSERPSSVATLRKGSPSGKPAGRRRRKNRAGSPDGGGLGAWPIVDDISERPDSRSEREDEDPAASSMYEAATSYINSFLEDQTSVGRLTLLQSLIIELGLASSSLPASLTAAKAMLKSRAFLNVGEYLDARQKGPAAVQGVMHPSKTSLIKDLKKRRNTTPVRWVKETGLQVLLVSCYH